MMALPQSDDASIDAVCEEIEQWVGPRRLYPISFCIPESLILAAPPDKAQDTGQGISRGHRNYRFGPGQQQAYYEDYQRSTLGLTYKKGGWDCMRHLEILANGCLPFFPGIGDCPRFTMAHYPKEMIETIYCHCAPAVILDGYELKINDDRLQAAGLDLTATVKTLLDHTRKYLTTTAMARYMLQRAGHSDAKRVLYVCRSNKPDYLGNLLFHGLRQLLGADCVDASKLWWLYDSADPARVGKLYGNGFTYSRHLPDIDIDRGSIKQRIAKRDFDLVVFGTTNRCHDLLPLVRKHYDREEVVLIDGEDSQRLIGWSKKISPPKRRPDTARKLPAGDIIKQGITFKRELDHAAVIAYSQAQDST